MSKEKIKYKIISVNTASAHAGISEKLLKDALKANSKCILIEIDGATEKGIYHSNSKEECEVERDRLKKNN